MKNTIIVGLIICLPLTLHAQTIIPSGPVSGLWTQAGSPYLIQGDIAIDNSSTLTIEPGVDVIFQGYFRLLCEGQLLAVGTAEDSIQFLPADSVGKWDGIDFVDLSLNTMDSSRVEYCEISYGLASRRIGEIEFGYGGGLYISNSSKLLVSNTLFAYNKTADVNGENGINGSSQSYDGQPGESIISKDGGAMFCIDSDIIIDNSLIRYCKTGNSVGGNGGTGYHPPYWGGGRFRWQWWNRRKCCFWFRGCILFPKFKFFTY